MAAGRRNCRVMFQRNIPVENDHGDQLPDWQKLGNAWVAIAYGRGDERRLAASEQRVQSATVIALATSMTRSVTVQDRIVHHDQAWNIVGIVPRLEKGEIDFDVRRAD
jgi:head-tail adaptor